MRALFADALRNPAVATFAGMGGALAATGVVMGGTYAASVKVRLCVCVCVCAACVGVWVRELPPALR